MKPYRNMTTTALTAAEAARVRAEYAALPRGPGGIVSKGFRQLLCRKWGISTAHLMRVLAGQGH